MELFGIGPLELIFIVMIALIVLGPKDMVKAGRTVGAFLRRIVTSPTWHTFQQTSREIRHLPTKLIREAGLEQMEKDIKELREATKGPDLGELNKEVSSWQSGISSWTTPPPTIASPPPPGEPDPAEEPSNTPSTDNEQG